MKKTKKIRYKRRLLIYSSLTALILFTITDYYFEAFGLPNSLAMYLQEQFYKKGLDVNFNKIKLGVIHGLILTKPILLDHANKNAYLKAQKLKIGFTFSLSSKSWFSINSFEIKGGKMSFPLFPEYGEEGENDIIEINNVNAILQFEDKLIHVKEFSGTLYPFHLAAAGAFKNFFLYNINNNTQFFPSKLSMLPMIKKIPYLSRAAIYREILRFRTTSFPTVKPECNVIFNLDAKHFAESFLKADIISPALTYNGIDIQNVHTSLLLKGFKVQLENLEMQLATKSTIKIKGVLDLLNKNITSHVTLKVLPSELSTIMEAGHLQLPHLPSFIKLQDKPLTIVAQLNNFSLSSMVFKGFMQISIPAAEIQGVTVYNFNADLFINHKRISASRFSCRTSKNAINGNFDYYFSSNSLDIHANSNGSPILIKKFLHKKKHKLMLETLDRFTFPRKPADVNFVLDTHIVFDIKPFYFVSAELNMNNFSYSDIYFQSASSKIIFDSNALYIISPIFLKNNNLHAKLAVVYDHRKNFKYQQQSKFFKLPTKKNNRLITEIDGNFPGNDVLICIFPDWKNDVIDLSESLNMKAHGAIDFFDMQKTLFWVAVKDSPCKWNKIPLKHVTADLFFRGSYMFISNARGKIYTGDWTFNYLFNFKTWKGYFDLVIDNADFTSVAKYIGNELGKQKQGKLSLNSKAFLYYDKNKNLFMNGKGKLNIKDADMWDIPIINAFGDMTKKWIGHDWGVISTLNADFYYKNDHVYSENIVTDGTVISLNAKGSYYWNTKDYDFKIQAKLLKNTLPFHISKIFNPLSWLLETRVYRKNNKTKWEKIHSVKKLFKIK